MSPKNDEIRYANCAYIHCGKRFQIKNYNQKFCTDECRNNHHNDFKQAAIAAYREQQKKKAQS